MAFFSTVFAESDERQGVRVWQDVAPKLEEILEREERQRDLPRSAWIGEDKQSNRSAINQLLDEAVAILAQPAVSDLDYRQSIAALERKIRSLEQQIADYRRDRLIAPENSLWQKTSSDYDTEIEQGEAQIKAYRQRIAELKKAFAAELRRQGITISDEQLDFLLSTVIGENLIEMGMAFDNVKLVVGQLEQLLVESGESLHVAQRYYGLYTVLLRALGHMHQDLLNTVAGYVEELDAITDKTRTLMAQSRALRRVSKRHQSTLAANIEAQRLTVRTAAVYRDYLVGQARDVAASNKALAHDIAVAQNTYETVKVSGDLVQMIHKGQHLLDNLFARQAPTLFTFQNLEMKREFEKLTARLKTER